MEIIYIAILLLALIVYFLPTVIASQRKANSTGMIFLVNLFAGWTGIVWLIILIWACEGRTKKD